MEDEKFDYICGLKLLIYLKNEVGLLFSRGHVSNFKIQFEACRGEDDLKAITRKAYASVPFTNKPRRDTGPYDNWLDRFDRAFEASEIPKLLGDNVSLKQIICDVDLSEYNLE